MPHTCHAHGCQTPVPESLVMCRAHWFAVPKRLRDAIWSEYRRGQEFDKSPSSRYMAVQQQAIGEVAFKPDDEAAAAAAAPYLLRAQRWRERAIRDGQGDPLPWEPRHEGVEALG